MKFLFVVFLLEYCAEESYVITFMEKNIRVIIHYIQTFIYHIYSWVLTEKKNSKRYAYNMYHTLYTCHFKSKLKRLSLT